MLTIINFIRLWVLPAVLATWITLATGQTTVIQPSLPISNRSFAIIVDSRTYQACEENLLAYREAIEKQGLPTYIIHEQWASPAAIRSHIKSLHTHQHLEGIVLIGEIPIPMIRKAQHLATAFKLDEEQFDRRDSSVPSDRYYDDLDLRFDSVGQDENNPLFFYYNLAAKSPHTVQSDIYSGRIMPLRLADKDSFEQINSYLKKVTEAKTRENAIDQVFTYLGDGTLSNSLSAWAPESDRLQQQFPGVFRSAGQVQTLRFDMWDTPKNAIIQQLKREDLDMAFFHQHGLPETMHLSGEMTSPAISRSTIQQYVWKLALRHAKGQDELSSFFKTNLETYHLDSSYQARFDPQAFKVAQKERESHQILNSSEIDSIAPNAKFIVLDACYNGDFRENDYVAGRFIFSPSGTLAVFAHTVSILQDVHASHLIGALGMGMSIGKWAQYNNSLESHIIGDPTLRFAPNQPVDLDATLAAASNQEWIDRIAQPSCPDELRNILLTELHLRDYPGIENLTRALFHNASAAITRLTCLTIAFKRGGQLQLDLVKQGMQDSDELVRRLSINRSAFIGHPELIPHIIDAYLNSAHASRLVFNLTMAMYSFDDQLLEAELRRQLERKPWRQKDAWLARFEKNRRTGFYHDLDNAILDPKASYRNLSISSLKNVNYHPSVPQYIALAFDTNEKEQTRVNMLESLAWFGQSHQKNHIIQACQRLLSDLSQTPAVRMAAERTLYTIQ